MMYVSGSGDTSEWWSLPGDADCYEMDPEMVAMDTDRAACGAPSDPQLPTKHKNMASLERPLGFLNVFKRMASPPPPAGDSAVPRASLSALSMPSSPALLGKQQPAQQQPQPHQPTAPSPKNNADLIVKRSVPMKPPHLSTCQVVGDGDDEDVELELAGGWRAALTAILLSACVTLLFVTVSVPLDSLLSLRHGHHHTPSSSFSNNQPTTQSLPELFDWRTVAHLVAVVSACREVQVAKRALVEIVQLAVLVVDVEPVRFVVVVVQEIMEAVRALLMAFF